MSVQDRPFLDRLKGWLVTTALGVRRRSTDGAAGTQPDLPGVRPGGERWDEILRVQELTLNLLSNKVTPEELFRHVVDGAADSLGADEASLMLVEGEDLRVASSTRTRAGEAEAWKPMAELPILKLSKTRSAFGIKPDGKKSSTSVTLSAAACAWTSA